MIDRSLNLVSGLPGLREYFTFSVHSMWRDPNGSTSSFSKTAAGD
jgi:hypothetical protein